MYCNKYFAMAINFFSSSKYDFYLVSLLSLEWKVFGSSDSRFSFFSTFGLSKLANEQYRKVDNISITLKSLTVIHTPVQNIVI